MYHADVATEFTRQMGYSRREFLGTLDAAYRDTGYRRVGDDVVEIPVDDGCVTIRLGADQERRIASLAMPFIDVEFRFKGLDAARRRVFFASFQRSFQKGGG